MYNTPSYFYGAVIGYNDARTPGLGSAIFLHVSHGSSTAGCVALPTDQLLSLLRWLDPAKSPRDRDRDARRTYEFLMPRAGDPDVPLTPGLAEWSGAPLVDARPSAQPRPVETEHRVLTEEPRTATPRPRPTSTAARPLPAPLQPGRRAPARRAALPAEEQAARPAAAHRAARARAPRQADRARGVRVRQPLVVGVRDRGDAAGPHPGHRPRRVRARRADHDRAARRARSS